jgi:hypothetical protein
MTKGRWSVGIILVLAASLLFGPLDGRAAAAGDGDAFPAFWQDFGAAALQGDNDRLAPMIAVPFIVEDTTDAQTRLDEVAAVLELMPALLEQDVGLSAEPESMRHYIERQGEATDAMLEPGGERARIGQFLFERTGDRWMFVGAYLEQ